MADYKIQLGVDLKVNDIRDRITQYNKNSNNAKLKLGIKLDTDDLKRQINQLNLGGTGSGRGVAIPINTQSLESSLKEVKSIITDIKNSLGTLDGSGDIKSLVSSINQMATALGKAENESDSLVKSLSALSKKDFSLNIGLDMGKKNNNMIAYGRAARKQVIPELEAQIKELENLFGGQQATMSKLTKYGGKVGFDIFTDFGDFNSDSAIKKMEAMEKYINSLKKLASIDNINLSGFNEVHKDASQLINDIAGIETAVDKAGDVPEKIKNLFGGGVDGERVSAQLDSIVTDLGEIKVALQGLSSGVSIEGLTQSFDRLSETIEKLVSNVTLAKNALGDGLGASVSDNGTENAIQEQNELAQTSTQSANTVVQNEERKQQAYRETANESQRLSDEAEALKKDINFNDASIDSMKQSFQELGIAIDSVTVNLKNGELDSFTIKGTDGIERTVSATQRLDDELVKVTQSFAKVNNQADKIEFKIDTGKFTAQIAKVTSDFNKLSIESDEIEVDINSLNQHFANMQTAAANGDIETLINSYKEYERILESVNNKLDIHKVKQQEANRQQKQNSNDAALTEAKKALSWDIDNYLKNNTAAAKQFGDTIRKIRIAIDTCDDSDALKNLKAQFQNVKSEANYTLNSTQSFGDRIKKQFAQYSSYLSVASLFSYGTQALRSMFEQVKLIDSAMTELKKVTNETDAAYNKFLKNAATRSKEIGTTIDGLVSSTADFARLGYGFEDAQGLAEVANIYAVVGDEINGVEGATESLISTMAAFKDEMNGMSNTDFAMSIIDKFNEIGNNFAISSGGIGEALERSASSLMAANNTIDESIALITAANTVVQDPEQVGTAFKTISMRIRGAKTEMSELGLDTEGMVDSTAKLREEIMALSGVDIMISPTEFKSTYQIMDELAQKWKSLTDIQQAKCLPDNVEIH